LKGKTGEEEDCNVPACKTMLDILKSAAGAAAGATLGGEGGAAAAGKEANNNNKSATPPPSSSSSSSTSSDTQNYAAWRKANCPLDKDSLGDSTWGLLHSTAAYYPGVYVCDYIYSVFDEREMDAHIHIYRGA
jgi:hypothetical protein